MQGRRLSKLIKVNVAEILVNVWNSFSKLSTETERVDLYIESITKENWRACRKKSVQSINPFVLNASFLYPPEDMRKPQGGRMEVEKTCIENELVKTTIYNSG